MTTTLLFAPQIFRPSYGPVVVIFDGLSYNPKITKVHKNLNIPTCGLICLPVLFLMAVLFFFRDVLPWKKMSKNALKPNLETASYVQKL